MNFGKVAKAMETGLAVLQLVPAVIDVVKKAEEVLPLPGMGKEKLALVKDIMSEAYDGLNEIWPKLEQIIARFVEFANKVGIFKKSASA